MWLFSICISKVFTHRRSWDHFSFFHQHLRGELDVAFCAPLDVFWMYSMYMCTPGYLFKDQMPNVKSSSVLMQDSHRHDLENWSGVVWNCYTRNKEGWLINLTCWALLQTKARSSFLPLTASCCVAHRSMFSEGTVCVLSAVPLIHVKSYGK